MCCVFGFQGMGMNAIYVYRDSHKIFQQNQDTHKQYTAETKEKNSRTSYYLYDVAFHNATHPGHLITVPESKQT
jgi:hypothetical protein